MSIDDLELFSEGRYKIRAYMHHLFDRNMPKYLPSPNISKIEAMVEKIFNQVPQIENAYILDASGTQITRNMHRGDAKRPNNEGTNLSEKAYFYRTTKHKRCTLTDPYPDVNTNKLVVTSAYPIYNEKKELLYVVCLDIELEKTAILISQSRNKKHFIIFSKCSYFAFALGLFCVAALLFYKGTHNLYLKLVASIDIDIETVFNSTILLTLSLAIFDLVKTIVEEEILDRLEHKEKTAIHKTMVSFLGSIIIALAIEALMLVFKFAITDISKITSAVYLIGAVAVLLVSLGFYVKSVKTSEKNVE